MEPELKFDLTFILGGVQPIFVMLTEMERKYLWSFCSQLAPFPSSPSSSHCHISVNFKTHFCIEQYLPSEVFSFQSEHAQNSLSRQRYSEGTPSYPFIPLPPLHYSSQNAPPNPLPSHQLLNLHKIDFKFPFQPQKLDWQNYC